MADISTTLDNIQAHYDFVSDLLDDSANTNDLTHSGTPTYTTTSGITGLDLELSVPEYAKIADGSQSGLDIAGDFSVSVWVNFESIAGGQKAIFSKWQGSTNNKSYLFAYNSNLTFFTSDDGAGASSVSVAWTPSLATWYHLGIVYDASAGSAKFYVNGAQQGTTQTGLKTSLFNSNSDAAVGAFNTLSSPAWPMDGIVASLTVTSDIISGAEFSTLYNAGTPLPYASGGGGGFAFSQSVVIM